MSNEDFIVIAVILFVVFRSAWDAAEEAQERSLSSDFLHHREAYRPREGWNEGEGGGSIRNVQEAVAS